MVWGSAISWINPISMLSVFADLLSLALGVTVLLAAFIFESPTKYSAYPINRIGATIGNNNILTARLRGNHLHLKNNTYFCIYKTSEF